MSRLQRVWAAPAAIAGASTAGLAGALLLEGEAARLAACLALSAPVVAVGWRLASALRVRERT